MRAGVPAAAEGKMWDESEDGNFTHSPFVFYEICSGRTAHLQMGRRWFSPLAVSSCAPPCDWPRGNSREKRRTETSLKSSQQRVVPQAKAARSGFHDSFDSITSRESKDSFKTSKRSSWKNWDISQIFSSLVRHPTPSAQAGAKQGEVAFKCRRPLSPLTFWEWL